MINTCDKMDAIKCLKSRRTIRKFKDEEIPEEDLLEMVDCGRLAPTANNTQPWEFILVQDDDTLNEIGEICTYGDFVKEASACIIVAGDNEIGHLIEDGSAATENILLAANALGYSGGWIAGWQKSYANELLDLISANQLELVSVLAIGIPKETPSPEKRDLDNVLHKEEYKK